MSKLLHENDDAKTIAISRVFSENSRANKKGSVLSLIHVFPGLHNF